MASATKSSEWCVFGAITTDLKHCFEEFPCMDITSRTITKGNSTFYYCGVGANAKLVAIGQAQKTPGTLTLQGISDEVIDTIADFHAVDCQGALQLRHCKGRIYHLTNVDYGDIASTTSLTAKGINATDEVLVDTVAATFDRMVTIFQPSKVPTGQFVSNEGYHELEALLGVVNDVNVSFRITDIPLSGYPIEIYIDGVLQTTGFTITGRNVVFDVAPACGEVLTVTYYSEEYAVYGLCPKKIVFCSDTCDTTRRCLECGDLFGIYETSIQADPDVCGVTDGNVTAVVRWDYSRTGEVDWNTLQLLENIVGVNDTICTDKGRLVIAADNGIFEGCGGSVYSAISSTGLPAGAVVRKLAYDNEDGRIYGLYGNSGIVMRQPTGNWSTAVSDGLLTTEFQNDIDAQSGSIFTVGDANTVQVSANNGSTWTLRDGAGTVNYSIQSVAVGETADPSDDRVAAYTVSYDSASNVTELNCTDDWAVNWSDTRKSWDGEYENVSICSFEDWLLYVQLDDQTWRNTNRGCDRCDSWHNLLESGYTCSILTCCQKNPNKIAIYSRPSQAAVPDSGTLSGTALTVGTFDVVANDYTEIENCAIDPTTLVVGTISSNIDGNVTVAVVANEIQVTVDTVIADGTVGYIQYTVDTTCGDTLNGLLVIDFLA